MTENWLLVVNPHARNGSNGKLAGRAGRLLDAEGVRYDMVETNSLDHVSQVISRGRTRGYSRVVAIGGDGTAHHVANGAIAAGLPFGLIPAGSGNDFAGSIGLGNDLEHAIETLVHGRREAIGVVKVTTREGVHYSINLVDAGIGAQAAVAAQTRLKWLRGPLRYNLISLGTILGHKDTPALVTLDDGEAREINLTMVICGFGQTAAAGMHFLPDSRFTNETMQGCVFHDAGKLKALRVLQRVWRAGHIHMTDIVEVFTAARVTVETIDPSAPLWVESEGEVRGRTKATMEALPRGLEVFVPEAFSLTGPSRLVKGF